jgi:hypothetical protein
VGLRHKPGGESLRRRKASLRGGGAGALKAPAEERMEIWSSEKESMVDA